MSVYEFNLFVVASSPICPDKWVEFETSKDLLKTRS